MPLPEVVEIDPQTRLVFGQGLDLAHGQPDVANAIVHLTGETLVLVDTGVTIAFRDALAAAAESLGTWSEVLLLTTHGHADHVGNNDLIESLAADLPLGRARHYVSAFDAGQLLDNGQTYWTRSLARVQGLVRGVDDPAASAQALMSIFQPMVPRTRFTRTFEELPLEHLRVGPLHLSGWSFCDGAIQAIRTRGHCAGQIVVHLADSKLIHLSDESNGPCGAMHDANQLNIVRAVGDALTLVETGHVDVVTEGHRFELLRRDAAIARLSDILNQAAELDAAAGRLIGADSCDTATFIDEFTAEAERIGVTGANPNPMFNAMTALEKLHDQGLVPSGDGPEQKWRRPRLNTEP